MAYDIGQITRELQQEFRLFAPRARPGVVTEPQTNRATPENLVILTNALQEMTDELQTWRDSFSSFVPDASIDDWDADMAAWRTRLDDYSLAASGAPPGDRQAVLWDVTAPMLLGFYGGPSSKLPQQPLDAVTPFRLANMLLVSDEWREARWNLLLDDLAAGAKAVVDTTSSALPWVIGLSALAVLAWKVTS